MRILIAFGAGGLFGIGLLLSGMTDTQKVLGWLYVFGAWDPTLAFVMGGAILPMAVAWRMTRINQPYTGGVFPPPAPSRIDRRLIAGSVLFGMGGGLAGLCPGPTMASLTFGGTGGIVFLGAMIAGMWGAPFIGSWLDRPTAAA